MKVHKMSLGNAIPATSVDAKYASGLNVADITVGSTTKSVKVPDASTSAKGVVQVGSRLSVTNGVVSADDMKPLAGSNVTIGSDGRTVNVNIPATPEAGRLLEKDGGKFHVKVDSTLKNSDGSVKAADYVGINSSGQLVGKTVSIPVQSVTVQNHGTGERIATINVNGSSFHIQQNNSAPVMAGGYAFDFANAKKLSFLRISMTSFDSSGTSYIPDQSEKWSFLQNGGDDFPLKQWGFDSEREVATCGEVFSKYSNTKSGCFGISEEILSDLGINSNYAIALLRTDEPTERNYTGFGERTLFFFDINNGKRIFTQEIYATEKISGKEGTSTYFDQHLTLRDTSKNKISFTNHILRTQDSENKFIIGSLGYVGIGNTNISKSDCVHMGRSWYKWAGADTYQVEFVGIFMDQDLDGLVSGSNSKFQTYSNEHDGFSIFAGYKFPPIYSPNNELHIAAKHVSGLSHSGAYDGDSSIFLYQFLIIPVI